MKSFNKILTGAFLATTLLLTACSSDGKQKYGNLSKDENKTESRTYNIPYVAEISSKVETEVELKNNARENKDKDTYDWTGTSSKTIESIKIKYKQDYSDREYKYTYDIVSGKYKYKWVTVRRTRIDECVYKYHDNKLEFVNQSQRTE